LSSWPYLSLWYLQLDMDGVASVVYGDLKVAGLPARLEESSEDDDYSVPAQPACLNNYAVSPRLLARLLRKVQVRNLSGDMN
jgi:hypothetical protein